MTRVPWNVGLALAWVGMTGRLTAASLMVGFAIGYLVLSLTERPHALMGPLHRMRRAAELLAIFVWELLLANLRVAWDVVTPSHRMRPGVVAVPLEARSDLEIILLTNMVSLTPGTLSLDVSDDRRVLYIHAMYLHDRDRVLRSIKCGFERRLLEVLRRSSSCTRRLSWSRRRWPGSRRGCWWPSSDW
jgi:multicomponent Na+:H+ antiporter subunit E